MAYRIFLALLAGACFSTACSTVGSSMAQGEEGEGGLGSIELINPVAPTWIVNARKVDAGVFALSLRAKHFRKGGDGEAFLVIRQYAEQLQRAEGAAGYQIIDYSEWIESGVPFSYRAAKGKVVLVSAR